jgi:hypothetical protein
MPLEIRELHIKAVVGNESRTAAAPRVDASREEDREALVAECVAQVLEILERESER